MNLQNFGITTTANRIEELQSQIFEVFETPSNYFCPIDDTLKPDGFYTISNANGNIHGKVNNPGHILSMSELLNIAYDVSLNYDMDLNFNKANINYFKDESICTLKIPLGISEFTNNKGMNDQTEIFLFIKTGFGGTSCTELGVYSHRFICSNGMEVRNGLNYFKAKHTENMNLKAKVFLSNHLPKMLNSTNNFTEMAQALDKKLITSVDIEAFKQSIFNYKDAEELSTRKSNQLEAFNQALEIEMQRGGQTAWTLLQGATNYTNHLHSNAGQEFIVTGSGATINEKAERQVLELIK